MQYLCVKQLTAGNTQYHPGEIIPDGIILPERSGKLIKSGYIKEFNAENPHGDVSGQDKLFTQDEVNSIIVRTIAETEKKNEDRLAEQQRYVAELQEFDSDAYNGTVQISVKGESNGDNEQFMAIPAKPEEIQQVFSIMQMNAEEGAKVISDISNENVLILLHAVDSRSTIKNAAKKQATKLFSNEGVTNESSNGNETTGTNTEGADT